MAHAFLAPSGAHITFKCAASALRSMQVNARIDLLSQVGAEFYGLDKEATDRFEINLSPDQTAAEDGTIYHEVFEECVDNGITSPKDIQHIIDQRDDLSSGAKTDEFIHKKLVHCIQEQIHFLEDCDFFVVEKKVKIKGLPQFGHTDLVAGKDRVMYMRDLKTGRVDVHAEGNEQLMVYAVGILDEMGWDRFDTVEIKPLGLHWEADEWVVEVEDLLVFKNETMLPAFMNAYSINPTATPGDHCLYCDAKIHCKEWQEKFKALDNEYFKNNDIKECDSDELVKMFRMTKQADQLGKILNPELLQRAEGFNPPKNIAVVKGRRIQKWKDEAAAAKKIGDDKFYKKEAKSPSNFEPAQKEGLYTETFARGYLK